MAPKEIENRGTYQGRASEVLFFPHMVQFHDAMVPLHIYMNIREFHTAQTDLHEFEDGVVLLDEEVRGVAPVVEHHVGLPVLGRDALGAKFNRNILAQVLP